LKSRHVKERVKRWKKRRSKPPSPVTRYLPEGWLNLNVYSRNDVVKTRFFSKTYGRNVGKTFVGNNYFVQSNQVSGLSLDFKSWAKALSDFSVTVTASFDKLSESLKEQAAAYAKIVEEQKRKREEEMKRLSVAPGETPDVMGTLTGYRAFGFRSWLGPKLWPVAHAGYEWVPGRNEAVVCPNGRTAAEPHPYPWCDCGFWAMWDPVDIPYGPLMQHQNKEYTEIRSYGDWESRWIQTQEGGYGGYIWGQIEAWGVVVEAELGFRAQFAKITELYDGPWDPPSPAAELYIHSLGVAYGVPVREPNFDFNYD
jgi:hypothetical protein